MRDALTRVFKKIIRSAAAAADACPSFAHTVTWVTPERKPPFVQAILDPKITDNDKMPGKGPPAVGEDGRLVVISEYPRFRRTRHVSAAADLGRAAGGVHDLVSASGTSWGLHG
jgi:hypothetical protein